MALSHVARGETLIGAQGSSRASSSKVAASGSLFGNAVQSGGGSGTSWSSGTRTTPRQNSSSQRACLAGDGTSNRRQRQANKTGIVRSWRSTSDRKPTRVPPPRVREATRATAQGTIATDERPCVLVNDAMGRINSGAWRGSRCSLHGLDWDRYQAFPKGCSAAASRERPTTPPRQSQGERLGQVRDKAQLRWKPNDTSKMARGPDGQRAISIKGWQDDRCRCDKTKRRRRQRQ